MTQPPLPSEDTIKLSFRNILEGIINRPLIVILSVTLVTLFFAWQIPRLSFKTSVYDLIIENLDATARYEAFKDIFGSNEIIRVVIKTENILSPVTFKKIEEIEKQLSGINGVRRVISLPGIKRDIDAGGDMDLKAFAKMLLPVDLFRKNILSEDQKTTAVTLVLGNEADDEAVIEAVDQIISNASTDLSIYQIGMPLVSQALSMFTQKDFFRLPPLTFMIIAVLLFLLFRNFHCLALPIVCVSFSLVWTFGFMALTGIPLSMVTVIVPVFLIAVGTAYCLHICTEYLIQCRSAESPSEAVFLAFSRISFPTALAVITTVIGLGSLLINRITAIREFAIFSCFGIVSLLVIVLTFFPAALALLPIPKKEKSSTASKPGPVDKLLSSIVDLNLKHQRITLPIIGIVAVFCLFGIFQIRVETNPVGFFKENIPVSRHFHDIYQDLSGSFPINVVMGSEQQDFFEKAENVAGVERVQAFMETLDGVDKTISFADYMKLVNYASNRFEPAYYRLPEKDFEVRMLLNSYRMILGEDMLTRFMSPDFSKANILLLTHISSSSRFLDTRKKIQDHVKKQFSNDLSWEITGLSMVISKSSHLLTMGQVKSLSITMVIVFIIMFLLFLSSKVGFIAVIPNLFPIIINFGIMGWFGIELSMATSLIASIAIGLAVDDTIHYLVRYNREFKKDLDDKRALRDTLTHMGRPIVFTTITISLGFSILAFSSFEPTAIFGTMMVITMICALIGDLILLPSLMLHVELITLWDLVRLKIGSEPRHGIPLFKGLSRTQVHYIIMAGKLVQIPAGEVVMRKGEQSDSMYAVISGEFDVMDPLADDGFDDDRGIHKLVNRLKKGDIVGEMGLIRSAPRSATVVASMTGELLQVNLKMIKRLQWLYPPVAQKFLFNLMTILCDRLENTTHSLSQACLVDDLTCVCNRRGFLKAFEAETYRARRFGEELSFGVIKVGFKSQSPNLNFESRNRLLRQLGESLSQNARKCDTCGRIDAETFAILMPKTSRQKARILCHRLQEVFKQIRFASDGISLDVTVSLMDIGTDLSNITGEELIQKAEKGFPFESP